MLYKNNCISQIILRIDFSEISDFGKDDEIPSEIKEIIKEKFPEGDIIKNKEFKIDLDSSTDAPMQTKGFDSFSYIFDNMNENEITKELKFDSSFLSIYYNGKYYDSFEQILNDMNLILKFLELYEIKKLRKLV